MVFRWSWVQIHPARPNCPKKLHMSREFFERSVRLRGAAVWAAYGAVEALFAVMLRRALFGAAFVPADVRHTLFLLIVYPLVGALLGRFAMAGLAIAFAANAVAVIGGRGVGGSGGGGRVVVLVFLGGAGVGGALFLAPRLGGRRGGGFLTR